MSWQDYLPNQYDGYVRLDGWAYVVVLLEVAFYSLWLKVRDELEVFWWRHELKKWRRKHAHPPK